MSIHININNYIIFILGMLDYLGPERYFKFMVKGAESSPCISPFISSLLNTSYDPAFSFLQGLLRYPLFCYQVDGKQHIAEDQKQ